MIRVLLIHALITVTLLSCNYAEENGEQNESSRKTGNKELDYSTIELKVERGAFHYDTFILSEDSIIFEPKKNGIGNENDLDYFQRSSKAIEKKVFKNYIDELIRKGILEMEDFYDENSTCTSGLSICLTINGKVKKITCTDFERGCPDLLYQIENDLIKMHGKKLFRKFLPG